MLPSFVPPPELENLRVILQIPEHESRATIRVLIVPAAASASFSVKGRLLYPNYSCGIK